MIGRQESETVHRHPSKFAVCSSHPFHHPPRAPIPNPDSLQRSVPFFSPNYITPSSSVHPTPTSLPVSLLPHPTLTTPRRQFRLLHTSISARYFPPFSSVKLSKRTEQTYLSCFFASISDLYEHLLRRLQRLCGMRIGAFEDRSEPGSPTTSTAASGLRDMADQGPSFDVVVIGCGGGPFETNLSA